MIGPDVSMEETFIALIERYDEGERDERPSA